MRVGLLSLMGQTSRPISYQSVISGPYGFNMQLTEKLSYQVKGLCADSHVLFPMSLFLGLFDLSLGDVIRGFMT